MNFGCPVDYDIDKCSSKEFGLACDTCYHRGAKTSEALRNINKILDKDEFEKTLSKELGISREELLAKSISEVINMVAEEWNKLQ